MAQFVDSTGGNTVEDILQKLFSMSDEDYRAFQARLIPEISYDTVIGVRVPQLRSYARELIRTGEYVDFIARLPHRYYDENMLHSCIVGEIKDLDYCIACLDSFLPHVDNWAVCDIIHPKVLKKYADEVFEKVVQWVRSDDLYTERFGLNTLMNNYLDDKFHPEVLEIAAGARTDKYYLSMMVAWLFATALAKQYESSLPYLVNHRLDRETHNRAIRKALESYRIGSETKAYLRTLKR